MVGVSEGVVGVWSIVAMVTAEARMSEASGIKWRHRCQGRQRKWKNQQWSWRRLGQQRQWKRQTAMAAG